MADKRLPGIWLPIVVLVLAGLASCSGSRTRYPAGPIGVAVWDFEDLSPMEHGQDGLSEMLTARVTARIDEAGGYQMVERKKLLRVMEELHLGSSQLADADTRLRLGRLIGARQLVFGAFQVIGRTMRLDLRCVDVDSGRILRTAKGIAASEGVGAWLDAADKAAAELITP
jgi:curli biogenesis system outer membrane secretion channel CsgG